VNLTLCIEVAVAKRKYQEVIADLKAKGEM